MVKNQMPPQHLEIMSKNLLKDIEAIITEGKAQISDKIMERLRGETIFLPKSYVDAMKEAIHCTIDPDKCLDISLVEIENEIVENSDKVDLIKQGIVAIKANSFGPYYPKEYFKESTFKILWLLKEPYIEYPSFKSGDRGGHNQAAEYAAYGVKGNETHMNIVTYTRNLLHSIGEIDTNVSDEEVMKHICVLEVNHFPGLYLKKLEIVDKSLIKWAVQNKEFLSTLLNFYDPAIIFFASTLELFNNTIGNFSEVQDLYNSGSLKIFNDEIIEWAYVYAEDKQEKDVLIQKNPVIDKSKVIRVGRNIKYLGKSGKIYIQGYQTVAPENAYFHPNKRDLLIEIDGNRIKEWRSRGLIKTKPLKEKPHVI